MTPHLVVDLSGHGYGHAGMTIPVLNALRREIPALTLTLRTTVPRDWLAERLGGPFDHVAEADFGMAMADALHVLPEASAAAYRRRHADWPAQVAGAAARLAALEPTLLLANIGYLGLAASRRAGIPSLAYSSLNWADIFAHYCGDLPGARAILDEMADAYAAAELFLQPAPSMPMPSIANGRPIGPVARLGRDRRAELRRHLGAGDEEIVALVTLGGIATALPVADWPDRAGLRIVLSGDAPDHPRVTPLDALGMPFTDVLRAADVVVTKTGYGTLAEAVCNGTPILHVPRPGWPETVPFSAWIARHGRAAAITERQLRKGDFLDAARALLAQPAPPPPAPAGIADAVAEIAARLV